MVSTARAGATSATSGTTIAAEMVVLRADFLKIVQQIPTLQIGNTLKKISRDVHCCAAKLINTFHRWTSWKSAAYKLTPEQCWIWMPIMPFTPRQPGLDRAIDSTQLALLPPAELVEPEAKHRTCLYDELLGEHGKDAIRLALALLQQIGLLKRGTNPNGQDKTYRYQLDLNQLNQFLASPPSGVVQSAPQSVQTTLDVAEPPTTTEIRTETSSIPTTQTVVVGEKEDQELQERYSELEGLDPSQPISESSSQDSKTDLSSPKEASGDSNSALPPLLRQIKSLGADLNDSGLQRAIATFPEQVAIAVQVMQAYTKPITKPTRFLVQAIQKKWQIERSTVTPAPETIDFQQVAASCQLAASRQDFAWIQAKLLDLNQRGYRSEVELLTNLHPEWIAAVPVAAVPVAEVPAIADEDLLQQIARELVRLGWTAEQEESWMIACYGRRSLVELSLAQHWEVLANLQLEEAGC